MSFIDKVPVELVFLGQEFENTTDLFKQVSDKAQSLGYVNDGFCEAITAREANFPTGLQLVEHGVAIPHTDPEHVAKEFIAIVVNEQPVEFKSMEDMSATVAADLVFVLGLKEAEGQLATLQELMGVMQDTEVINSVLEAKSAEEVIRHFKA